MKFYAPGKLMISGEYLVLDGAYALSLPSKFGQYLEVSEGEINAKQNIHWESYDHQRKRWFHAAYERNEKTFTCNTSDNASMANTLKNLLEIIVENKPNIFQKHTDYHFKTRLKFDRHWGLGSSSTLISVLADWSGINPYKLLDFSFGGSGYDVAVAQQKTPILYQNVHRKRDVQSVDLRWKFKDKLFFIYQNKKQSSQEQIKKYRTQKRPSLHLINQISQISFDLSNCSRLDEFEELLNQHESIISVLINQAPLAEKFPEFKGSIKSLGAWGGDFFLATGNEEDMEYFRDKGYATVLSFDQLFDPWKSMK